MSKNNIEIELVKAQEFYKVRKYSKAIEIYDNCYADDFDKFSKWDRLYYAWGLYYTGIKNFKNYRDLMEIAEKILSLVSQADTCKSDLPCPYTSTVFFILKYYANRNKFENVIEWSKKLNYRLLSKSPVKFNGIEYPSYREKWYSFISKALLKNEDYEDSITVSEKALSDLDEFYGDNDIWFKFRIAKAKKELGDFDIAISYLIAILDFKSEWFIEYELSDNYFLKANYDESLNFAFKAALNKGPSIMKTKLYLLISDLLESKSMYKKANDHLYLIFALKKEHSFFIDQSLEEQLKQQNYDLKNFDSKNIENELRKYWKSSIVN